AGTNHGAVRIGKPGEMFDRPAVCKMAAFARTLNRNRRRIKVRTICRALLSAVRTMAAFARLPNRNRQFMTVRKISRALLSVSDKTGLVELARDLAERGVE